MKFKHSFLLFSMVLFTVNVSNASPPEKQKCKTEVCDNPCVISFEQATDLIQFETISIVSDAENALSPQVPPISQRENIERWYRQERIRLCYGFISNLANPPNIRV